MLGKLELESLRLLGARRDVAKRELEQARRHVGCCVRARVPRSGLELGDHVRVRPVARESEMMCAFGRIGDDCRKVAVNCPPPRRRSGGVDGGREQRVREAHAARGVDRHEAGFLGCCESRLIDEVCVRTCERGRAKERIASRRRQRSHARAHERAEAVRDRQRRNGVLHAAAFELARDLDRVERIARRRLRDANQDRPRERPAGCVAQDAVERRDRKGPDLDPLRSPRPAGSAARCASRRSRARSRRRGGAVRTRVQLPTGGRATAGRRSRSRLRIPPASSRRSVRSAVADDAPRGWAGGVRAKQRDVEPAPLRCGKRVERSSGSADVRSATPPNESRTSDSGRTRDQDRCSARPCPLDRFTPDRRLADTRLADDRERLCRSVEKRVDCLQLRLAPNDPRHTQSVRRGHCAGLGFGSGASSAKLLLGLPNCRRCVVDVDLCLRGELVSFVRGALGFAQTLPCLGKRGTCFLQLLVLRDGFGFGARFDGGDASPASALKPSSGAAA